MLGPRVYLRVHPFGPETPATEVFTSAIELHA
jgi:hypothetical protein